MGPSTRPSTQWAWLPRRPRTQSSRANIGREREYLQSRSKAKKYCKFGFEITHLFHIISDQASFALQPEQDCVLFSPCILVADLRSHRCHHICKINFCYRLAYNKRCTGWIGVRENIHWGYSLDAKEVMNGWKSSSFYPGKITTPISKMFL